MRLLRGPGMKPMASVFSLSLLLLSSTAWGQSGRNPPGQAAPYLPAAGPQAEASAEPATRTVRYGEYVFLADLVTWTALSTASSAESDEVVQFAALGLFLGGPAVHLAHENYLGAGLSAGARVGLPLLGVALAKATCSKQEEGWRCLEDAWAGALLGYGAALTLDWFYFAETEETLQPTGWASLRPSLQVDEHSARAGFHMAF